MRAIVRIAPTAAPGLLAALAVGLVARTYGGWWPTTWGWAAVVLLLTAAVALLLLRANPLERLDTFFLSALGALAAWTALSWIWAESQPLVPHELERTLAYVGGVLALLLVVRRCSVAVLLAGLLTTSVLISLDALATRLFPDLYTRPFSSVDSRLAGVFGYPNALGICAGIGLLLALGFVADGESTTRRALAAVATVPLVCALYFTFSRGSWLALAVGAVAAVALSPSRRRLVTAGAPLVVAGALIVFLASRSTQLTRWSDPRAAAGDGHDLALALLLLAAGLAVLELGHGSRSLIAFGAIPAAVIATVVATTGISAPPNPYVPVQPPPSKPSVGQPTRATTTGRVFNTNSNTRSDYWRVALIDAEDHPLLGSGAGTFVREWYRHRHTHVSVQDAHSLYLETLAELGPVGVLLLLAMLTVPAAAALRVRSRPLFVATFGAYAAYAAHAAVDWDWELPAVTLAGLFCGVALIAAARREPARADTTARRRSLAFGGVVSLLVLSFVGLVGSRAEANSLAASWRSDWNTTDTQAARARFWAPWSTEALVLQSDAASARGSTAAALDLLRRAIAKDPNDYDLWKRVAALSTGAERTHALEREHRLNPLG